MVKENKRIVVNTGGEDTGNTFLNSLRLPLPMPGSSKSNPSKTEIALVERIKELNCMYGMAILSERYSESLEEFLQNLVRIIPPSWQFPEITRARIVFDGRTYKTEDFKTSRWRQSSRITIYQELRGEVEVFYLQECPPEDEGPFLKEERFLLDAISEGISKTAIRIHAENELRETNRQLTVEREALKEANLALKTLMRKIEEEKANISKSVQSNVDKILMPVLHAMALEMPENKKKYIEILQKNLSEITSPFVNDLSRKYYSLSPTEIKICNLIRNGMRTKEISQIQGISTSTVNRHREHIRQKLGLNNKNINLATYLQSSMWEEEKLGV